MGYIIILLNQFWHNISLGIITTNDCFSKELARKKIDARKSSFNRKYLNNILCHFVKKLKESHNN